MNGMAECWCGAHFEITKLESVAMYEQWLMATLNQHEIVAHPDQPKKPSGKKAKRK